MRGLHCPEPVVRAGKALRDSAPGGEIVVVADDPFTAVDLRAFCQAHRHEFVGQREYRGTIEIRLRKAGVDGSR